MNYRSLKTEFHAHGTRAAAELLEQRQHSDSTLHWPFHVGDGQLFCVLSLDVHAYIEKILNTERTIALQWNELSGAAQHHYLRSLIIEEVMATNAIEQIHSTRRELAAALNAAESANPTATRFREAVRLYLDAVSKDVTLPQIPEEIRALYDRLMLDEVSEKDHPDGDLFRANPVYISNGTKEVHRGVNPESAIVEGLLVMLRSMNDNESPAPLVTTLMCHFMFEYLHPFYDGNGRLGRYLLGLSLTQALSAPTALSLSRTLSRNKEAYYKAFLETENPLNHADGTIFLCRLLHLLHAAQRNLSAEISERKQALDTLWASVKQLSNRFGEQEMSILFVLGQAHLFNSENGILHRTVVEYVPTGDRQTRRWTARLQERGLIELHGERPLRYGLTAEGRSLLGLE
ncbi:MULTISPECIES: Fic family protein [unclassified Corynebacterium]|uniref:Fic family protein n=1 Tax=unclassified Corynebacterium TaxID=2624378 RepID=UPI0029C9C99C|nr:MULTISPECIES: Fic family protein [unclassified Corynebacterium]WPF66459.1 Fic family protein [Corynebacterium sp. 22KM0430]WPF68949.1 Fic family protein [Corynebacterium sp. 21KM1197]